MVPAKVRFPPLLTTLRPIDPNPDVEDSPGLADPRMLRLCVSPLYRGADVKALGYGEIRLTSYILKYGPETASSIFPAPVLCLVVVRPSNLLELIMTYVESNVLTLFVPMVPPLELSLCESRPVIPKGLLLTR